MTRQPWNYAPRRGFTLVELTIVVLIIGILSVAAVGRFADALSYHRADAAASRIEADLRLARRHAIASSSSRTVAFLPETHTYTLSGVNDLDHHSRQYRVVLSEAPYHATLRSVDFEKAKEVTFDGYGVPDSGGTIVVQSGQYVKTITLDSASGEPTKS